MANQIQQNFGIFQSDVILRTALIAGIADLRANPWLLDYVFCSLPEDGLTARQYGAEQVRLAKQWFLNQEIHVFMKTRLGDFSSSMPALTIDLIESTEIENTLSDQHYDPVQLLTAPAPTLLGPFTPMDYNAATGILTLPVLDQTLPLSSAMILVDNSGRQYALTVLNDSTVQVTPNANTDFSKATLISGPPSYARTMESIKVKESYALGCWVEGEPAYLTYLHSIVVFILLRYRETLLEARGLERTTIGSSDFSKMETLEVENCYSRFITVTGTAMHTWPKRFGPTVQSTVFQPIINGLPYAQGIPVNDAPFVGVDDILNTSMFPSINTVPGPPIGIQPIPAQTLDTDNTEVTYTFDD